MQKDIHGPLNLGSVKCFKTKAEIVICSKSGEHKRTSTKSLSALWKSAGCHNLVESNSTLKFAAMIEN